MEATARPAGTLPRVGAALLAAALLAGLTGCSQGASGTLDQALKDGTSATVTASKAMRLFAEGRSTTGVSGSALQDMLQQLNSSEGQVAQAGTDSDADRRARLRVLRALQAAVAAVTEADDTLSGTAGAPPAAAVVADLDRATARLSGLEKHGGTE